MVKETQKQIELKKKNCFTVETIPLGSWPQLQRM